MKFGIISSLVFVGAVIGATAFSAPKAPPVDKNPAPNVGKPCHNDQDCGMGPYYCSGGSLWDVGVCTKLGK
jgi:hypothetical protein